MNKMDPDSTIALLTSELPSVKHTPLINRYPLSDDDSEEEVFFGGHTPSQKEKKKSILNRINHGNLNEQSPNNVSKHVNFSPYTEKASIYSPISEADESSLRKNSDDENNPPVLDLRTSRLSSSGKRRSKLSDVFKPFQELDINEKDSKNILEDSFKSCDNQKDEQIGSRETSKTYIEESTEDDNREDRLNESFCEDSLNSVDESEWFNNTHDEMILYEKYGESYDEMLENLSRSEKKKLKKEIANLVPKSAHELLGQDASGLEEKPDQDEEEEEDNEIQFKVFKYDSPNSKATSEVVQPPIPKPRTLTPQKIREQEEKIEIENKKSAIKMLQDELNDGYVDSNKYCEPYSTATYTRKSNSSQRKTDDIQINKIPLNTGTKQKVLNQTPIKPKSTDFKYPSTPRCCNTPKNLAIPSYLRPTSASKHRASPRKDPSTNETLDITICSRHAYAHSPEPLPDPYLKKTTKHFNVQSPVARYIRENRPFFH